MAEPLIVCRNVWKIFGSAPKALLRDHGGAPGAAAMKTSGHVGAVRDVSLDVPRGEILVVMGLSGSGKSTLVRCLSRLIEPDAGQILIEGQDLLQASRKELIELRRHKMGMVFQHFALLPHRTVLQNVAFPLEVQGIDRQKREARAREMINLVGLKGREGYYPRELSGGQQQRVGIARSVAVGPDLWFLDEPFSALDPLIRREMQDEFLRLQSMLNKTIVFITHDFGEAIRLADRIAIMYEGEIVQIGRPVDIITKPATNYVRLFIKDVAREKILKVESIMSAPAPGQIADGPSIHADDTLAAAAPIVLRAPESMPVIGVDGQVVGNVDRDQMIAAIYPAGSGPA